MTNLTIDGETFRVEVEGDPSRPALLLSSSLGADLSMWNAQMPAFLAQFRVVRYDPRGHGGSTRAGAPYSLARLGADALAILDALDIERTHFLGISMGGAVGQWLLVNAPERIDRAVLANTNARFGAPQGWNERIRSAVSHGTQALAAATMERWFSAGFRTDHADEVAAMDKVFRATSSEGYAAACAALRDMDMREALRAVDRPVLLVTGRDDSIASAADIATMLGAIPRAAHRARLQAHLQHRGTGRVRRRRGRVPDGADPREQSAREGEPTSQTGDATPRPAVDGGAQPAEAGPGGRDPGPPTPCQRIRADRGEARTRQGESAQGREAGLHAARLAGRGPRARRQGCGGEEPGPQSQARQGAGNGEAPAWRDHLPATRKAVAKKAVTKKAVTKKGAVKKAVAKKIVKKATPTRRSPPSPQRAGRRRRRVPDVPADAAGGEGRPRSSPSRFFSRHRSAPRER